MSDGQREERAPYLPSGYHLDEAMRELVVLRREDGSEVAAFGATGAGPKEIERAAREDFGGRRWPGT